MSTTTILGVFNTADSARRALEELRSSGLELRDTSLVTQGQAGDEKLNAPEGALVGAAWGGLVGLVALAIPGIGPFIAGGAVAAALTGAAAGAVVGGIGGALMQSTNLSEEDAKRYEGAVHSGKTLVVVKADEAHALDVRRILAHDGADSIHENQTDILHGAATEVSMYTEAGRPVHHGAVHGSDVDVEGVPNTLRTPGIATYEREVASARDLDFNDAKSARELLDNEQTDDSPMANGARITSYEDSQKHAPEPPREPKI